MTVKIGFGKRGESTKPTSEPERSDEGTAECRADNVCPRLCMLHHAELRNTKVYNKEERVPPVHANMRRYRGSGVLMVLQKVVNQILDVC